MQASPCSLFDGTVAQRDVKYWRPLSALMPAVADYFALGRELEGGTCHTVLARSPRLGFGVGDDLRRLPGTVEDGLLTR